MKQLFDEFKEFITKGNLVEIAVAFVVGTAFAAVTLAFNKGIVMAFIAAVFGKPSFDNMRLKVGDGYILYGTFLTALLNFLVVALIMFFVVKGYNLLRKEKDEEETGPDETELLTQIRDLLAQQNRQA